MYCLHNVFTFIYLLLLFIYYYSKIEKVRAESIRKLMDCGHGEVISGCSSDERFVPECEHL